MSDYDLYNSVEEKFCKDPDAMTEDDWRMMDQWSGDKPQLPDKYKHGESAGLSDFQ